MRSRGAAGQGGSIGRRGAHGNLSLFQMGDVGGGGGGVINDWKGFEMLNFPSEHGKRATVGDIMCFIGGRTK